MAVGIIYALRNPETSEIFYVGSTIGELPKRLSQHITESRFLTKPVHHVIEKMISSGYTPSIERLQEIEGQDPALLKTALLGKENEWVKLISETQSLSNVVYNEKRIIKRSKPIVDKELIEKLISSYEIPIYQIEKELGMPQTTLQKALKGERHLPKKWINKLREPIKEKERLAAQGFISLSVDYSRPEKEYEILVRGVADKDSISKLMQEVEANTVLSDAAKKGLKLRISFKLQRTKT